MNLSVSERLFRLSELPTEGDETTMVMVTNLSKRLAFTPEEIERWGITFEGDVINWEINGEAEIDLDGGHELRPFGYRLDVKQYGKRRNNIGF